jgi:microcystin-dependent protein
MAQPFIGQVIAVGFPFAPDGWLPCDGRLVSIAQYTALYQLIGTTYGGDGQATFALPNLSGRVALDQGQGPGLSPRVIGQVGGSEVVSLSSNQVGAHSHGLIASSKVGSSNTPGTATALAQNAQTLVNAYSSAAANTSLTAASIGPAGTGQPHENRQPFLAINYVIAWQGAYPTQS